MWDRAEDAEMRLNGSIVVRNGQPVQVLGVRQHNNKILVNYVCLPKGDPAQAYTGDPGWDWKPIKVGYVNYGKGAYYVERKPIRKWKQGLHKDNISVTPEVAGGNGIFLTPEFLAAYNNEYPKLDEAVKAVTSKVRRGCAFSRNFAITKLEVGPLYLEYMGMIVGWREGDQMHLGEEFLYLKEVLDETLKEAA